MRVPCCNNRLFFHVTTCRGNESVEIRDDRNVLLAQLHADKLETSRHPIVSVSSGPLQFWAELRPGARSFLEAEVRFNDAPRPCVTFLEMEHDAETAPARTRIYGSGAGKR